MIRTNNSIKIGDIPCLNLFNRGTYNDAVQSLHTGRISQADFDAYMLFWEWSAFRASSLKQDRCWNKLGKDAFYRRIERMNRLCEKWLRKRFAYCLEE